MPLWLRRTPALVGVDMILHISEKFTKLICCGNLYNNNSVFVLINFYEKYIIVKYTPDLKLFFIMANSLWIEKTKAQGLTLKC